MFDWSLFQDLEPPRTPSPRDGASDADARRLPTAFAPPTMTAKLAAILVALDRIWRVFTSPQLHDDFRSQLDARVELVGGHSGLQCTLEELLSQAETLSGLYLDVSDHVALVRLNGNTEDAIVPLPQIQRSSLDHATVNILLAAHLRFLDVLDSLLVFARICASLAPSLPSDYDPDFDVPEIRVGSFVAPKSTAASIFISILVDLQTVLLERGRKIYTLLPPTELDAPSEVTMLHLQLENLTSRCNKSLGETKMLREHLIQAGAIR
ncbi:PQ loop repeat protein [Purpureocillium lavendulum]|uniref:Nitrogen assimilation transcription factor nit-4 n=1 Tax=Purpureocillium lavendulum TaxID=1247861 RepID=A0AB34FHN4_9HYPO|nr:Nitrogen assimilation transcription factor nit-4 [Purpureocillium lavendulum]KAJ6438730.1 PQ loop repeat protein [Purpureocillium lavendulum]